MDNTYNFNAKTLDKGHHQVLYRGLKAIKCPFDYVNYQMIISELKPDLIIEIGTAYGGSCLYLADLLESIGSGVIHTIDISEDWFNSNPKDLRDLVDNNKRIKRFLGGYQNYELSNTIGFEKILLIEDGSHHYSDVLDVLNKFNSIISKDSYIIVEDGALSWLGLENQYDGGPLRAIKEFLEVNKDFEIDRKWCDLFGYNATFNPNGYLKKI
jgi:cephalosporin hydroxylase